MTGYFTLSLDTELAWGSFDTVGVSAHREAFLNTRDVVDDLCSLFDQYDISATWALVAHLLADCDGEHPASSGDAYEELNEWYEPLPCSNDTDRELWYAPELPDRIRACSARQEIGLHGYTHLLFPEYSRAAATAELERAFSVARDYGIEPDSFVYPRNRIGHRDILREHGIDVYRGIDRRWYEQASLEPVRKLARFADEASQLTPPVVEPRVRDGLVEVPGSQIFRPNHGGWQYTPRRSQVVRAKKGLERAVETDRVFHLWFHPFNLAREPGPLIGALEDILAHANSLREDGRLEVRPLQWYADANL
jgi:peptidoglycan/xylan/chitin deacetylase (PgdA/CDA1 family)